LKLYLALSIASLRSDRFAAANAVQFASRKLLESPTECTGWLLGQTAKEELKDENPVGER